MIASGDIETLRAAAYGGNGRAHNLLADRARVLGRTAAVVRDMVDPDRVVLVGQAFTGYPPVLEDVVGRAPRALGPRPRRRLRSPASAPGSRPRPPAPSRSVPVYEDPLALVRVRRQPSPTSDRSPAPPTHPHVTP